MLPARADAELHQFERLRNGDPLYWADEQKLYCGGIEVKDCIILHCTFSCDQQLYSLLCRLVGRWAGSPVQPLAATVFALGS